MRSIVENEENKEIKKKARKILKDAKIPVSFLGFKYLEEMMLIDYNDMFTGRLYEETAKKFHVLPQRVKGAVRYICESYQNQLKKYFNTNVKITSKKLIFLLRYKLFEEF